MMMMMEAWEDEKLVFASSWYFFEKNAKFTLTLGAALCSFPRGIPTTKSQITMIPLSVAALTNAGKPGFSALIFTDVKTPTGNSAEYKQTAADDLGQMGLVARTEDIFFGKPAGCSSEHTTMAVVAEVNNDADRYLRTIVGGRPLAGSVMQAAEHFGAITMRDGSMTSTASPVRRQCAWRFRFR